MHIAVLVIGAVVFLVSILAILRHSPLPPRRTPAPFPEAEARPPAQPPSLPPPPSPPPPPPPPPPAPPAAPASPPPPPATKRQPHVLVTCHDQPFSGHWLEGFLSNFIKDKFETELESEKVITADIGFYAQHNVNRQRATLKTDVFSQKFIDAHRHKFDVVVYPDCGGKWVSVQEGQERGDIQQFVNTIGSIVVGVYEVVRPGGWLLFGKVFFDKDIVVSGLKIYLGFTDVELREYENSVTFYAVRKHE